MNALLYEVIYFLQKDSYFKKLYYFSRTYSALCTAQIVVNSQFTWKSTSTSWLQNILLWLSFPITKTSMTQFYILFAFTFAVILLTVGLYYFVARHIMTGTMNNIRITQILRFFLGLVLMLANPIFNVLLGSFNCDWVGGTNLSLLWDTTQSCLTSSPRIILMCVSAVAFVPFAGLVLLSATMHINDPKSGMVLARAHSRVDLLSVGVDMFLNALFTFVTGYERLLAAIYIGLQLSVVASYIVFQPYFHGISNDFLTMLAAIPLWAGLAFAVLLGIGSDGAVASIVLLAGVVPFGLLIFWASSYWRAFVINQALEEHDPNPQEDVEVSLLDGEVFPVLREKYDRNSTTFFMVDVKAAMVELQTRFLMRDDSARAMRVAENILKKGLLEYPQSIYLRLQYVSFLLYYRNDPNHASIRLDEVSGLDVDLDMRFTLLRRKREVERTRHLRQTGQVGGFGSDSISYEEIKTRMKAAQALHKKAIELSEQLWKTLARKKGGGSRRRKQRSRPRPLTGQVMATRVHPDTDASSVASGPQGEDGLVISNADALQEDVLPLIASLVEQLFFVIAMADAEYSVLWSQSKKESREVGAEYARYLRNIKKDTAAADEIEDQLSGGRAGAGGSQAGGDNSSRDGGSSQGLSDQTAEQQQRRQKMSALAAAFASRISSFKLQLRIITFLLMAAAVCSFAGFYLLSNQAIPVFESLVESGYRQFSCALSPHQLRQMHLSALQGDAAGFLSIRSALNTSLLDAREIQYGLMTTYRTNFALRNDFMSTQSINVRRVGSATTIVSEKVSPDELVMKMIDFALEAVQQPMSKYATLIGPALLGFPQYFYILENGQECTRATDTASTMFWLELEQILHTASQLSIAMSLIIILLEFFTVCFLFRGTVNRMFNDLARNILRLARVPLDTTKELASMETKHLARFRVLAGDEAVDHSSVMDIQESDGTETRNRSSSQISPRPSRIGASSRKSLGHLSPRDELSLRTPRDLTFGSPSREKSSGPLSARLAFQAKSESLSVDPMVTFPEVPLPKTEKTDADLSAPRRPVLDFDRPKPAAAQDPFHGLDLEPYYDNEADEKSKIEPPPVKRIVSQELTVGEDDDDTASNASPVPSFRMAKSPDISYDKAPVARASSTSPNSSADSTTEEQDDNRRSRRSRRNTETTEMGDAFEERGRSSSQPTGIVGKISKLFRGFFRSESKEVWKRKLPIVATYVFMLFVITACTIVVTALSDQAVNTILTAAPIVINSMRRRYMFAWSIFYGYEMFYSGQIFSFVGTGLSSFTVPELRCRLTAVACMGQMMHYGVLYGKRQGFDVLPSARNMPSVDSIINSECSAVTRDIDLFHRSIEMSGLATDSTFSNFYFVPQCPSTNDFDPNSIQMTNPRIYRFTKVLSPSGCPLFRSGQATSGFHRLVDSSFTSSLLISKTNLSSTSELNALVADPGIGQVVILQDPATDLHMGLVKVVLLTQGYSINLISNNQTIMGAVFAVLIVMIILQYILLGRRLQRLIRNDLAMTVLIERTLENAGVVMKKQGYTNAEVKRMMKGGMQLKDENEDVMASGPQLNDLINNTQNDVELTLVSGSTVREGPKL